MDDKRDDFYYSYGPFKSREQEDDKSKEETKVEIHRPDPIKLHPQSRSYSTWEYKGAGKTAKQSSFKSIFAAFMAGVIVVSGLMFASDRMNLFTDTNAAGVPDSVNAPLQTQAEGNGGDEVVRNAALNIVRPNTIADIATQASPAVVKIETLVKAGRARGGSLFQDDIFRQWFGDPFGDGGSGQDSPQLTPGGMGSGFFFDPSGYILTNEHVISGAEEIYVVVEGHKEKYKAKKLGSDYDLDLAVLKIDDKNDFPYLNIGDSSKVRVGDWLTAIGNPAGFDHTVSVGVLSAREREIQIPDSQGVRKYKNLLQTDASINPGNSGGPLIDLNGEVIGINTAVSTQSQGIGFAIPTSTVMDVLEHLKSNKAVPKPAEPYIGVGLRDIEQQWVKELGLDSTDGSIVTQTVMNGPAHQAGIQVYDVITGLDGKIIKSTEALVDQIKQTEVGSRIKLTVIRDGKTYEIGVVVGDKNGSQEGK